jgi:hypothetical protein
MIAPFQGWMRGANEARGDGRRLPDRIADNAVSAVLTPGFPGAVTRRVTARTIADGAANAALQERRKTGAATRGYSRGIEGADPVLARTTWFRHERRHAAKDSAITCVTIAIGAEFAQERAQS